ncbi:hypothetical protein HDF16_004451 [Granulicella aggregans]|uniref:Uncharacterized protein n=1 Tax=Granulicella aggregans TaxID=474949 RepID=A0A7W7ZH05_9BACT|nr:hypothetical protein [Granulicella aggregans]MBB5059722.1 hypothetical protein [Granulicella aggregans]
MAQFIRNAALLALLLCFVKSLEAQTAKLSPDDTVSYINTTIHKYPTLEFVDSGCPGFEQAISISEDRRSLLIKQDFAHSVAGTCNSQTLTVPIFGLSQQGLGGWSRVGQHSAFLLDCKNHVDCFSRGSTAQHFPFSANKWYLRLTGPNQVSDELTRAIQHLVDSLLTEANGRLDGNDPFAKRSH